MNVLIIEDNLDLSELLIKQFSQNGFFVFHAANGKLALEVLKQERIDFILSDIQMPVMNGFEFLLAARSEFGPEIPIYIMTSSDLYAEKELYAAGANGLYKKPLNINELLKQIQKTS